MIRVLQILMDIGADSGVARVVFNWHKNIDRQQVQFDYLYLLPSDKSLQSGITALGGRAYKLDYKGILHPFYFIKQVRKFFKEHRYDIVHSHVTQMALFYYPFAKFCGVKNIIQHAHGIKWSDKFLNGARNYFMLHLVWHFIDGKLACSRKSAHVWYGGKNCKIIYNGVDLQKFAYSSSARAKTRKELKIENNFVIFNAARFSHEKNHDFLIDVFALVKQQKPEAVLLLAGGGPLEEDIKKKVSSAGLEKSVKFLGVAEDIAPLYQAADCFVLPSFQEGMPVTAVEAQACGLPCLFSAAVTKEVLILAQAARLSLTDGAQKWAQTLLKMHNPKREQASALLKKEGFDIKDAALEIQNFYSGLKI